MFARVSVGFFFFIMRKILMSDFKEKRLLIFIFVLWDGFYNYSLFHYFVSFLGTRIILLNTSTLNFSLARIDDFKDLSKVFMFFPVRNDEVKNISTDSETNLFTHGIVCAVEFSEHLQFSIFIKHNEIGYLYTCIHNVEIFWSINICALNLFLIV